MVLYLIALAPTCILIWQSRKLRSLRADNVRLLAAVSRSNDKADAIVASLHQIRRAIDHLTGATGRSEAALGAAMDGLCDKLDATLLTTGRLAPTGRPKRPRSYSIGFDEKGEFGPKEIQ